MRNEYRSRPLGLVLMVALVALAFSSCGERMVNENGATKLQIPVSTELTIARPMAAVDLYRLTVTDNEADSILTIVSLALNRSVLEGTLEDLPAGRLLTFLVEAVDSETGTVIYRGSATTIVVAGKTITLDIPLGPVVPLQRFTPRFVELRIDSSFVLDTWIENVDSLFGISFRVIWPDLLSLRIDSAQAGNDVSSPGIIFFAQPGAGSYHTFSITQTSAGETIVDADGRTHLARIYFTVEDFARVLPGTVQIEVQPTGLTGVDSTVMPVGDVYIDDCTLQFPPPVNLR